MSGLIVGYCAGVAYQSRVTARGYFVYIPVTGTSIFFNRRGGHNEYTFVLETGSMPLVSLEVGFLSLRILLYRVLLNQWRSSSNNGMFEPPILVDN